MSAGLSPTARKLLLLALALLLGGAVWYFGTRRASVATTSGRGEWREAPVPVRTVAAAQRDLPVHLKAIGTVTPFNTVVVRSRVDGQILQIAFEEGQVVEKGQLLAEIDPRSYRIQLARAEGEHRQQLAQLEAARNDLVRFQQLFDDTLVTQQQIEVQRSLVIEREGMLAVAEAQVEEARLQLAYTRIEAPIPGRLGLRQVDTGNLVRAGDANGIVVITQTRPISVMFTVPEVDLQRVLDPFRAGEKLVVEAWDRSERTRLAEGMLETIDNQIDVSTGTLRLRATFSNDDDRLFPNQFVNVRLRVRTQPGAIVVPGAAVQFGSRGTYVYVIDAEGAARVRDVVLGPSDGTDQSIAQGLDAGEPVVLEGLDRLREGRKVIVTNEEPQPADS
ncbi:MdtA/MuxA family multidrug efflux RND transporter periplasmic adaptor subunit [Opitutales bacterium ASA1]|uniref:MdtA/MuxA family multidrug efflux RND transporter periplasmic adaptor subunit n=1 Tax=Congregicoccus parvus TaxID=3081749 RepID=UPI002B27C70E|nr:MdtA/MuxA family multidrug efflux RND transporter periplasmic adaptor subunit [Opitutales bacterium ASA1]